jgi:hypothetical protein
MKTPGHEPHAPADPPEREWQLQERARELSNVGAEAIDPELARHLAVANALRRAPPVALPNGFAERVARLAAAERAAAPAGDDLFERRLLHGLVACMGLGAGASLVAYGGALVAATPRVEAGGLGWALAVLACLGLSWAWTRARPARPQPRRH